MLTLDMILSQKCVTNWTTKMAKWQMWLSIPASGERCKFPLVKCCYL